MKRVLVQKTGGILLLGSLLLGAAFSPRPAKPTVSARRVATLQSVFASDKQLGAVAVAPDGRLFVNYSRWFGPVSIAVAEVVKQQPVAYPDRSWNQGDEAPVGEHFLSVQSVYVDRDGRHLWVVDAANPQMQGMVSGGVKLVQIDLKTNRVARVIGFDASAAPAGSYFNDVRIDLPRQVAYLSDLGLGAVVVVDLASGKSRRLLENHPSVKSEEITMSINGKPWLMPDGSARRVNVTGIALDRPGEYLYYKPLTARKLYRIRTQYLRDKSLSPQALAGKVEYVATVGGTDSIDFGPDGYLYLTTYEHSSISRYKDGQLTQVIRDERLSWPRSVAFAADGSMYVTTYRLQEGDKPTDLYRIYKVAIP